MIFAIDTGGTFTDLVLDTGAELRLFKALTTPIDPVQGVLDVLEVAAGDLGLDRRHLLASGELLIHGTTHAINALVTNSTARTAFLTTQGHPDVLLFREGGRAEPFDFSTPYPEPFVPRSLTYEIPGRITADGTELAPLGEDAVINVLGRLGEAEVEAIGVALLWSIVNSTHEERVGELIETHLPGVPYTLSHRLNPTLREYRRASSTCIDASLKPLMSGYFSSLKGRLHASGFDGRVLIVTSQGGMLDAGDIAAAPIHSINSGPSMAPVAGAHYAAPDTGRTTAIVADTGGTTFDVSLVRDGRIPRTRETWIGPRHQGHVTGFPSVDVTSVGAGGGSVASLDRGGLLQVGPRSAGSNPGPACYGRGGTEPTVTDACAVLGYLDPELFLGGAMRLDLRAARAAVRRAVADPLGLELEHAAAAIMRIATENMVHGIEDITVSQGVDPREAVLVGGGGAAGLNVVDIARRLECPEVLIPETGAALSAAGALLSNLSTDFATTLVTSTDAFDAAGVNAALEALTENCRAFIARVAPGAPMAIDYAFEARYPRQNWEIEVPLDRFRFDEREDVTALAKAFHAMHERLFAISEPESRVEIVGWRARVRAGVRAGGARRLATAANGDRPQARREVWLPPSGWQVVDTVDLEALADGAELAGPAIVESSFTTIVLDAGATVRRTEHGTLSIRLTAR